MLTVVVATATAAAVTKQSYMSLAGNAGARELKNVGVTLGSLGNPFFVTISKGAEEKAHRINPQVRVISLSADYDLNKQVSQIDSFIGAGVDLIIINAVDPKAIEPAIRKAQKAGIVVVAVDVSAAGADATVMTDNVQAGELACDYIVKELKGQGNVIIQNGPQVSAVVDRVKGCKGVLSRSNGITVLSDDQDAKASREGMTIFSYPVNKAAFDGRKSLTVRIDFYDRPAMVLKR